MKRISPPRALGVVLLALSLGGCSWLSGEDTAKNNVNTDAANYRDLAIEAIYDTGWRQIRGGHWDVAAGIFDEMERQHPYSPWARRAMLMSAFCSYQANDYGAAINTANQYISLHPGSAEISYAYYLVAMSYYEQIVDVGRDQANTRDALVALQDVIQRFPDTEYARDATLKIDLTLDHLAGKEMNVGRYYLTRGDHIGAINRFRVVVEQYYSTPQVAEALERLTEAYYSLGLDSEAQTAAAVLGANYPGSGWYQNAYNILKGRNLKPEEDKRSWISQAFHRIL